MNYLKLIIKFFTIKIIILILFITVFINVFLLYLYLPNNNINNKDVIIQRNYSVRQIADKLHDNNIIRNAQIFYFLAKIYSKFYCPLKSGEYQFTANSSALKVLSTLCAGKSIIHKLIIPEGSTVQEIIDKINSEERLLGVINEKIPEGFLMPAIYYFSYGDKKIDIINQMRKLMSKNLDIVMKDLSINSPLKDRLEVLTLASIIEKETSLDSEKPIIASVFLNRLKKRMKLQADPTVIYAITEGKFKINRQLTLSDLKLDSPYNTYTVINLPPTPISCPGIASLKAVITPMDTNFLYFVSNGNGGHNFASDLETHNTNVINYRKLIQENKSN